MNDNTQITEQDQKSVALHQGIQPTRRMTLTPAVDVFEDGQGITLWACEWRSESAFKRRRPALTLTETYFELL